MSKGPDNQAAEALLHDIVAEASPSYEEAAAVSRLVAWMSQHGYDESFCDDAGNAVGIRGEGPRTIVLLGHIDTFSGMPPVRITDRKLYGRGSVDAKGPLCSFAVAAARAAIPEGWRFIVIGAVEEEAATSKGARYAATQYQPEMCIIGEPSHWDRITLGYKGRLLLDYRLEIPLAHSAGPIASPAEHAVDYWQQLAAWGEAINEDRTTYFDRLDVSLRDIRTYAEGVNGIAEMTIGFRLPADYPPELMLKLIPADPEASFSYRGAEQAYTGDKNSPLSRVMRSAIRAEQGTPRFVYKTGTADMNVVGPSWNCPILAYGPGDSSLDHTPDEHIDLDEYLQAIQVLTRALESL